jgi:hypothetical protein
VAINSLMENKKRERAREMKKAKLTFRVRGQSICMKMCIHERAKEGERERESHKKSFSSKERNIARAN